MFGGEGEKPYRGLGFDCRKKKGTRDEHFKFDFVENTGCVWWFGYKGWVVENSHGGWGPIRPLGNGC